MVRKATQAGCGWFSTNAIQQNQATTAMGYAPDTSGARRLRPMA